MSRTDDSGTNANRIVLLDSFAIDQGEPDSVWSELKTLGELVVYAHSEPGEVAARVGDAFAVLTNKVELDASELRALPQLRYIGVTATGSDIVDLAAARAAGIAVTNVPGYATDSVAELVFAHILQVSFDVAGHNAAVKAGIWAASADFCFFRQPLAELAGKTLVLVGSGAIGTTVGRIAEAFGMRVLQAAVPGAAERPDQPRIALDEALPAGDFVSLHCPLTEQTRGLVGADFLARMKPGAVLINTARGGLVDELALIAALESGHLGGAGLDVLSGEPPPPSHPLTDPRAPWAGRVVITPHIGWGSVEARRRLVEEITRNVAAFLRGDPRNRIV